MPMEQFMEPNREKLQKIREKGLPEKAKPHGDLKLQLYDSYYCFDRTITTGLATNPNDPDNPNYNSELVFAAHQRNAPKIWVLNTNAAGGDSLFVLVSHLGTERYSNVEIRIPPQMFAVVYDVYALKIRAATTGDTYIVSEYQYGSL